MPAPDATACWTEARAVLASRAGCVVLVRDAALAGDARILARARAIVAESGAMCTEIPVAASSDAESAAALAARLRAGDVVVAVGGGGILDLVVIARAFLDPRTRATVTSPQRAGLVALPLEAPQHPVVIAVPTTIGTGAESSAVATCVVDGGRRLVLGRTLRADVAVFDPEATSGMPRDVYAAGLVEILLRLAGPYVSDDDAPAYSSETTLALARALGDLSRRPPSPDVRRDALRIGALSHSPHLVHGSQTFGTRAWYVANELSSVASVPKITALVDVTPLVWLRILAGDERWGRAERLRRFWTHAVRGHGADPVDGFRSWTRSLGAPGLSPAARRSIDPVALSERCVRRWGYGMPMLGPLRRHDLTSLFAELRDAAPGGGDGQDPTADRQVPREPATSKGGKK